MEVIRRGTPPEDTVLERECRDCHTLFSFKRSEGEFVHDQRDGNAITVNCPVCGKKCWFAA